MRKIPILYRKKTRCWIVFWIFCLSILPSPLLAKKGEKRIDGVKIKGKVVFFLTGAWNSSKVEISGNTVLPKGIEPFELDATAVKGSGKIYSIRIKKQSHPDINIGVRLMVDGSEAVRVFLKDLKDGSKTEKFRTIINESVKSRAYILEFLKPVPYSADVKMKLLLDDTLGTTIEAVLYHKSD